MKKITFLLFLFLASWHMGAQTLVIGTGTAATTNTGSDPIDGYYTAFRYQVVYTAAELSASMTPYDEITSLGFSISGDYGGGNLLGYTIKMGHTSAVNAAAHIASPTTVVKSPFDYNPTVTAPGVFDVITFDTPFIWNGVENIVIDICTDGSNPFTAPYGQVLGTAMVNGSRYYRVDDATACGVATTTTNGDRPNIQFTYTEGTPPSCLAPSGQTATGITASDATLGWTNNGSATQWNIEYGLNGFAMGTGTAVNGVSNPHSITGLSQNTTYQFYVQSDCGGTQSTWSGPYAFTTACSFMTAPTTVETFATYLPGCWSEAMGELTASSTLAGTTSNWASSTGFANAGTNKGVRINLYGGSVATPNNNWVISNGIDLGATPGVYQLKYRMAVTSYFGTVPQTTLGTHQVRVVVSTDNGATWSTANVIKTYTGAGSYSGTGMDEIILLSGYSGVIKIGFLATTTSFSPDIDFHIDDFVVEAVPACAPPLALTSSNVMFTTATISWAASTSAPADGYEYYYSTSNTPPDGATVSSGSTLAGDLSDDLTGLTANTTYYFWVKAICDGTTESAWSGPASFYTGYCTPAPASVDGQGITNVTMGSINNTTAGEPGHYGNYTAMSTTVGTGDTVNFSITYSTGYTYGTKIWVDWNNDVDFNDPGELVYTGLSAQPNPSTLSGSFMVPATALAGNHTIRIGGADNDAGPTDYCYTGFYGTFEDYTLNVVISACVAPTALNATAVTSTSATVNWTAPPSAPADGYDYYYSSSNTAPDAATTPSGSVAAGVTSADLTGLPAMSLTYVWVRSVCGPGNLSSWAGPLTINTTQVPGCASNPTPVDGAVNVPVGPVTLTWDVPTTGDAPTSYDLYVGNTAGTVTTFVGNYPTNTTGGALVLNNYNTVVYWRIEPKNSAGSATGCAVWSFTTEAAPGYCLNAPNGQYPGGAAGFTPTTCDGIFVNNITAFGYAGEYSLVNVVSGQTYQFGSSIATDFITISNAAGDTSFIAGTTPVTWVSTITGQVRFFTHADDQCASNTTSRTRSVICGVVVSDAPDYANLQWPETITIVQGGSAAVFGQVYEPGLTDVVPNIDGQAPGIQAWVGISPVGANTDPATWTNWIVATHNAAHISNNDEYTATIGATLAPGTYYYATRFRLNTGPFVYGGFDSGFWNGTTEVSGVLTVNAPPAPANDDCANAIALTAGGVYADQLTDATNVGATTSTDPAPTVCFGFNGGDVWYSVVVPASGSITIETGDSTTGGTGVDTVISMYTGTCGALTQVGCDDDSAATGAYSIEPLTGLTPGSTLFIRVYEYGNDNVGSFAVSAYDASLGNASFDSANFSFYPNPVKDVLSLSYSKNITNVSVFNLLGQQVLFNAINATEGQIDMSGFAAGAYLVKVTADNEIKTIKVIKE